MKLTKKIFKHNMPCNKQDKFLDQIIAMANEGFELINNLMLDALLKQMKQEKLAKSDAKSVLKLLGTSSKRGFSGEIPRIELDLSFTKNIMDRHLAAIKWILMGKSAGKEVEKIVEELGLKTRIPAGVVFGTFLNSIDVQRQFYEDLNGVNAPKINNNTLKYALDFVNEHSGNWCDKMVLEYRNKLLQSIQDKIADFNNNNVNDVHNAYHNLLEERNITVNQIKTIEAKQALIKEAVRDTIEHKMSLVQMKQHLKDTTHQYSTDWDRLVSTEIGMANGAGTHAAIIEIFGSEEDELLVASVNVRDNRCCDICEEWSRHPDGSLKLYRMKDIKPVGYNIGKKRRDWYLTPSSSHPSCRCTTVYIPKGFTVDNDGDLVILKPDQKLTIERTAAANG
jgi:hypothetical protein